MPKSTRIGKGPFVSPANLPELTKVPGTLRAWCGHRVGTERLEAAARPLEEEEKQESSLPPSKGEPSLGILRNNSWTSGDWWPCTIVGGQESQKP